MSTQLADLKLISAGVTWYHGPEKSVDEQGKMLPREYANKLKSIKRRYLDTPEGVVGTLQLKLESFGDLCGIVVGQMQS